MSQVSKDSPDFVPPGLSAPARPTVTARAATTTRLIPAESRKVDPKITLATGTYPLGGFGSRASAALADGLIFYLVTLLVGVLPFNNISITNIVDIVLNFLYFVGIIVWQGRTIGMRMVGLRVLKAEGTPPDLVTAFVRHFIPFMAYMFSILQTPYIRVVDGQVTTAPEGSSVATVATIFALIAVADYMWIFVDKRNQTLHDKIARTFVVKTR